MCTTLHQPLTHLFPSPLTPEEGLFTPLSVAYLWSVDCPKQSLSTIGRGGAINKHQAQSSAVPPRPGICPVGGRYLVKLSPGTCTVDFVRWQPPRRVICGDTHEIGITLNMTFQGVRKRFQTVVFRCVIIVSPLYSVPICDLPKLGTLVPR